MKSNKNKIIFAAVITVFLLIITIIMLFRFFTNRDDWIDNWVDERICKIEKGKAVRIGRSGRFFCEKIYKDAGTKCSSNKDCLSNMCDIDFSFIKNPKYWGKDTELLPSYITGKCRSSNVPSCSYSIIEDDRKIRYDTMICEY